MCVHACARVCVVGKDGVYDNSLYSQFYCEPKTDLKNEVYYFFLLKAKGGVFQEETSTCKGPVAQGSLRIISRPKGRPLWVERMRQGWWTWWSWKDR